MCLSGPLLALSLGLQTPIFLLEVSRSQLPIYLEVSSCTALPCGFRSRCRCQLGPRWPWGPLFCGCCVSVHSCPSPRRARLKSGGLWSSLWVRSYEEASSWGEGLEWELPG